MSHNPSTGSEPSFPHADLLQILQRMSGRLSRTWASTDPTHALQATLENILDETIEQVFPGESISAGVYAYDPQQGFVASAQRGPLADYMQAHPPRKDGTVMHALLAGESRFEDDTKNLSSEGPELSREGVQAGVKAFANIPLIVGNDAEAQPVGTLIINLQDRFHFSPERQSLLKVFADQAAIELQSARVHRRRLREQQALQRINTSTSAGDLQTTANLIASYAAELTNSPYATLWAMDPHAPQLNLTGSYVNHHNWAKPNHTLLLEEDAVSVKVVKNNHEIHAGSPPAIGDPGYAKWHKGCTDVFCVPLEASQEVVGALYVATDNSHGLQASHIEFIRQLAPQAAVALQNARLQLLRRQIITFQQNTSDVLALPEQAAQVRREFQRLNLDISGLFIALYNQNDNRIWLPEVWDHAKLVDDASKTPGSLYGPRLLGERKGLADWVIQHDATLHIENFAESERKREVDPEYRNDIHCCLAVPMRQGEEVVGVIGLRGYERPAMYTRYDREFLEGVANHVATVIDNAAWKDEAEREREQLRSERTLLDMVSRFQRNVTNILSLRGQAQQIHNELEKLGVDASGLFIATYDPASQEIRLPEVYDQSSAVADEAKERGTYFGPRRHGERQGFIDWMLDQSELTYLLVENLQNWEHADEIEEFYRRDIKSFMAVPLFRQESVIGFIGLRSQTDDAFSADEVDLFKALAGHIAIVIDNASLYDRSLNRFNAVSAFQQQVSGLNTAEGSSSGDAVEAQLGRIYQSAQDILAEYIDVRDMYIALLDEESETAAGSTRQVYFPLVFENGRRVDESEKHAGAPWGPRTLGAQSGLTERIVDTGAPLRSVGDWENWFQANRFQITSDSPHSFLGAPMKLGDKVIGVMALQNFSRPDAYDADHERLLETIARQAAIAIDNTEKYDLIHNRLQQRQREVEAVSQFQQKISALAPMQDTLDQIYDAAVEAMSGLMDTRDMYIALYDEASQVITFALAREDGEEAPRSSYGEDKPYAPRKLGKRGGLTDWLIQNKKSLLIEKDFQETATGLGIKTFSQAREGEGKPTLCWLGAPILIGDQVIGAIGLNNYKQESTFNKSHQRLLETIAAQASQAIYNAREHDATNRTLDRANQMLDRRVRELEAVSELQREISSLDNNVTEELEEVYAKTVEVMSGLMDTHNMYIALWNEDEQKTSFALVRENGKLPREDAFDSGQPWAPRSIKDRHGLTEWVIGNKTSLLIESGFFERAQRLGIEVFETPNMREQDKPTRSWLGAPMLIGERLIGVIGLNNTEKEYAYDQNHRQLLETIAAQTAVAIENARLVEESRRQRMKALPEISRRMAEAGSDPMETLHLIARTARDVTGSDLASVYLYDTTKEEFTSGVQIGRDGARTLEEGDGDLPDNKGVAHQIAIKLEKVTAETQDESVEFTGFASRHNISSFVGLPLTTVNRGVQTALGVLFVNFFHPHSFSDTELEILEHLATQAAVAIDYTATKRQAEAGEQLAALGAAAATLQHRLSNTINIILPSVSFLRATFGDAPEVAETLDIIERNAKFSTEVILRMQGPLQAEDFVAADINDMVRNAVQKCVKQSSDAYPNVHFIPYEGAPPSRHKDEANQVDLYVRLDDRITPTQARMGQLTEVFRVLIENAMKATQPTGRITVASRFSESGGRPYALVAITDTGGGIDEQTRTRLFKQPVPRKEFGEGAGLGLWLSNIIVRNHGGALRLMQTEPGAGTTFQVRIPINGTAKSTSRKGN